MFKTRSTTPFMGNSETTSASRYRNAAFWETSRQSRIAIARSDVLPQEKAAGYAGGTVIIASAA
jgi:hypothetical protein